jgi:hypothetical protein
VVKTVAAMAVTTVMFVRLLKFGFPNEQGELVGLAVIFL